MLNISLRAYLKNNRYSPPFFTPASLFASSEPGTWYDPSDLSTLFQDAAGTTPVTAAGQTVARMNDKSGNGHHATQVTAAARPILQQDGSGKHYLSFDGIDDRIGVTPVFDVGFQNAFHCCAHINETTTGTLNENRFSGIGDVDAALSAAGAADASIRFNDGFAPWDSGVYLQLSPNVMTLQMTGAVYNMRQNGTQVVNIDRGTQAQRTRGVYFGGLRASVAGKFYGAVVVQDVIDVDTRAQVESYLAGLSGATL